MAERISWKELRCHRFGGGIDGAPLCVILMMLLWERAPRSEPNQTERNGSELTFRGTSALNALFFYMIICVYLLCLDGGQLSASLLWHSFNKFVLAKRLHEPAVFNRNHILDPRPRATCRRAEPSLIGNFSSSFHLLMRLRLRLPLISVSLSRLALEFSSVELT